MDAVVVTGLIRDVLSRFSGQGVDYVVKITPSSGTNTTDPERVLDPCPSNVGVDDDADDYADDQGEDDSGDDQGGDDEADDDQGGDDDGDDD